MLNQYEATGADVELLEFLVGTNSYGISISKVSEIMQDCSVTPVPNSPDAVEGVFIPRDALITVIDLHTVLHTPRPTGKSIFIVCRFYNTYFAFRVTGVKGFQRISWHSVSEPPSVAGGTDGISTGVAKVDGHIIMLLDLEKIIADIGGETFNLPLQPAGKVNKNAGIMLIDDSPFLRRKTENFLKEQGFENIIIFSNGQAAWDYLDRTADVADINATVRVIVSDIEMPMMDGITLTKKIRADSRFDKLPILLFSSLIDERMAQKCIEAGAQAQYVKPDMNVLLNSIIKYTS